MVAVDNIDGVPMAHQVEVDEIFVGPNPMRKHQYSQLPEIEAWLANPNLDGYFQHRERKIRTDPDKTMFWTTEEMMVYGTGEIVGYRHRFRFSDANTAFQFKLQFGRDLLPLASKWVDKLR
jgi:hypothetical protein